jgi:hypothetical protein
VNRRDDVNGFVSSDQTAAERLAERAAHCVSQRLCRDRGELSLGLAHQLDVDDGHDAPYKPFVTTRFERVVRLRILRSGWYSGDSH